MDFIFAKVYAKFYICQINSSNSYYNHLLQKKEVNDLDLLFDDIDEINPENLNFDENQNNSEINVLFKKFFYFKNVIFSKVEIMGLIVSMKSFEKNENKEKLYLTIDDSTGRIQCICWKNKNPFIYEKIKNLFVSLKIN